MQSANWRADFSSSVGIDLVSGAAATTFMPSMNGRQLSDLLATSNIPRPFGGARDDGGVSGLASTDFSIRTFYGQSQFAGTSGPDNLTGTESDDYFDLSQGGNDSVNGLSGDDGFYFGAAFTSADTVVGGAGSNDQIGLQGDYTGANAVMVSAVNGIEVIALLPGFDYSVNVIRAAIAFDQALTVFAGTLGVGDDLTLNSFLLSGELKVFGGLGTDIISTAGSNDTILFGPGKFDPAVDRVFAGGGLDTVVLDGNYTFTVEFGSVEQLLLMPGPDGDFATYNLTLSDSLVMGGLTPGTFTVDGRSLETSLTVDGSLETNGGKHHLYGGNAADVLTSGSGTDTLYGGLGGDILTSGSANSGSTSTRIDILLYNDVAESAGTTYDHLVRFDEATDRIDLPFTVTGFAAPQSGTLDEEVLNAGLENAFAGLGAHQAGVFTATDGDLSGHTYLVVDADGADGYQAGLDYLFEIVSPVTPIDQLSLFI